MEAVDQTRNEVWQNWYRTTFSGRYYQLLGNKYLRKHRILSNALIFFGAGSVVPLILMWVDVIWMATVTLSVIGIALAIVSMMNMTGDYSRKGSEALSIALECEALTHEWSNLFADIQKDRLSDEEARAVMNRLKREAEIKTYRSGYLGMEVSDDDKLNQQAANGATQDMEEIYSNA